MKKNKKKELHGKKNTKKKTNKQKNYNNICTMNNETKKK